MTNQELFALIRKNPIGIGCGVLSLLLAGASYWRGDEIPDVEAELEQKSSDAARYEANLKASANLQEQYDALVAVNKAVDTRLVRAGKFSTNLQYFYDLESETGVKFTPDPRTGAPGAKKDAKAVYVYLPWTLSVQGSMPQLLTFIRRLENGTHFCRVNTVSLSSSADRNAPLTLMITLDLLGLP
jgi:hypothetical protein